MPKCFRNSAPDCPWSAERRLIVWCFLRYCIAEYNWNAEGLVFTMPFLSDVHKILDKESQIILPPKEKESLKSLLSLDKGESPDLSLSRVHENLGTDCAIFALQFIEAEEMDVKIELRNFAYQCAQQAYKIFDSIYNEPWLNDRVDIVETDYLKHHEMALDELTLLYEFFPIPRDEQGAQSALIGREALGCIVDALDVHAPSAAQSAGESLLKLLKNPGIHPDTGKE